jgi:hypothetical protein
MRKIILTFCVLISLASIAFAQSNTTESLTVTTYFPAPFGVYRNLKLNPSNSAPANTPSNAGLIYFDNTTNPKMIKYHNGTGWVNLTTPATPTPNYWNASGGNLYNDTANKVLIGTPSAAAAGTSKLYVQGDIKASGDVCTPLNGGKCLSQCKTICPGCPGGQACKPTNYIDPNTCPTGPTCPACPSSGCASGQSCKPDNYVAPCATGESCKGDCPASGCPSGQSCLAPCPPPTVCPACPGCASCCPTPPKPTLSCVQVYNVGSPPPCPSGYTQVACLERFSSASSATSTGGGLGTSCPYWNMGYTYAYSANVECCKAQ